MEALLSVHLNHTEHNLTKNIENEGLAQGTSVGIFPFLLSIIHQLS
jgi:hypothetical protein